MNYTRHKPREQKYKISNNPKGINVAIFGDPTPVIYFDKVETSTYSVYLYKDDKFVGELLFPDYKRVDAFVEYFKDIKES